MNERWATGKKKRGTNAKAIVLAEMVCDDDVSKKLYDATKDVWWRNPLGRKKREEARKGDCGPAVDAEGEAAIHLWITATRRAMKTARKQSSPKNAL